MAKTIELSGQELKITFNLTKIEQIEMQLGMSVFGELSKGMPQMRVLRALFVSGIQTQSNEGMTAAKAEKIYNDAVIKDGKFMDVMSVTMEALMEDMGFMFQTA